MDREVSRDPTYSEAIHCARLLIEPGENPEYERGQAELIADLWPDDELEFRSKEVHQDILGVNVDDGPPARMPDPDLTLLVGAQDAVRAQNISDGQRHISTFLIQSGCTGHIDDDGTLSHDGETCPIHERGGDVRQALVNLILNHGLSVSELHADVDASVQWIEDHPSATQFNDD